MWSPAKLAFFFLLTLVAHPCRCITSIAFDDFADYSPCQTVVAVGNPGNLEAFLRRSTYPVQAFSSLEDKLLRARRVRKDRCLHKHGPSCAKILIFVDTVVAAKIKTEYENIGFRAKDHFVFIQAPSDQDFFETDNIRRKFRFFTFAPARSQLTQTLRNPGRVKLNEFTMRGATMTIPPLVVKHGNSIGGSQVEMFYDAAKYYNISLTMDYDTSRRGGQGLPLPNGTWTGLIGALKRDDIDVTLIGLQVLRYPHVDHTSLLFLDPSSFLVKRPGIAVKWSALVGPFEPDLWLLWLSALLLTIIFSRTILWMSERDSKLLDDAGFIAITRPLAISWDQSVTLPRKLRPLLLFWLIPAIVVGTFYKDKLMNSLTFLEREDIPSSLEDFLLPQYESYELLQDGWLISFRLNNSKSPTISKLKHRFKYVKDGTGACAVAAALRERTACIGYDQFLAVSIATNLTVNYKFFAPVKRNKVIPGVPVSVGLRKDSPFTPDWNVIVGMFRDTGLYDRIHEDVLRRLKREGIASMTAKGKNSDVYKQLVHMMEDDWTLTAVRSLGLSHLLTLFILYGFVCFVSMAIFLREKLAEFYGNENPPVVHKIQAVYGLMSTSFMKKVGYLLHLFQRSIRKTRNANSSANGFFNTSPAQISTV